MVTGGGDVVLVERGDDGIALVTLNRPEQRNAVNPQIAHRLEAVVDELEADDTVRVVVLTGAGEGVFCAGADLRIVAAGRVDELMTARGGFAGFVKAARRKPWIAAVDGFALAGGCELALACDLIVASRTSAFGLPEVTRGLVAAAGGLFRLPRVLPPALALEAILTANRIPAEQAAASGMINRVTEPGEAVAGAIALAREIAANAPLAVQESLAIVRAAGAVHDAQFWAFSDDAMARLNRTEDLVEGATAFVEKRPPVWKGR